MGCTNIYNGINFCMAFSRKRKRDKIFQPTVLGLHDYISTYSTNNYDTILHHYWLPFAQEPTIEHRPSYNFGLFDLLQHHFWPFPSKLDRL